MGVKGLLKELKKTEKMIRLYERMKGKVLGVDAFVWLHQVALHHAGEVVRGEYANLIAGVIGRGKRFTRAGVQLYIVFDGLKMPGKSLVNDNRQAARARKLAYTNNAETAVDTEEYQAALKAAITITPGVAWQAMMAFRKAGYATLRAPYEADAQLRYLVSGDTE